ncbi:hypothetical protein NL676_018689 [Syzygium grande]|nr:hypothetical protein NL676_018689 [Syzygium grande]
MFVGQPAKLKIVSMERNDYRFGWCHGIAEAGGALGSAKVQWLVEAVDLVATVVAEAADFVWSCRSGQQRREGSGSLLVSRVCWGRRSGWLAQEICLGRAKSNRRTVEELSAPQGFQEVQVAACKSNTTGNNLRANRKGA